MRSLRFLRVAVVGLKVLTEEGAVEIGTWCVAVDMKNKDAHDVEVVGRDEEGRWAED